MNSFKWLNEFSCENWLTTSNGSTGLVSSMRLFYYKRFITDLEISVRACIELP